MGVMKDLLAKIYLPLQYLLLLALIANSSFLSYKYMHFYYWGGMFKMLGCKDDCDAVMMSKYAMFWKIPVPVWGLTAFVFVALAFVLVHNQKLLKGSALLTRLAEIAEHLLPWVLIIGCVLASLFISLLYFKLHMMCKFCMFSHICLFLFTLLYFMGYKTQR